MSKLYIGISGKMCVGKSTLSRGIMDTVGVDRASIVSLAKPIKDIQRNIYNSLGIDLKDKDRELLIALGMWGRGKNVNFWLNQAIGQMESSESQIILCDDVRFENEADWFQKNGILIRLEGIQRGENVDPSRFTDLSETSLDDYPFEHVLKNDVPSSEVLHDAIDIISTNGNLLCL